MFEELKAKMEEKRRLEKERLNNMTEKELMVEILLELKQINCKLR